MISWGDRDLKVGAVVPVTIVSSAPDTDTRAAEQAPETQTAHDRGSRSPKRRPSQSRPPPQPTPPVPTPKAAAKPAEKAPAPTPAKPAAKPAEKALDLDALAASLTKPARNAPHGPRRRPRGRPGAETAPVARQTVGSGLAAGAAVTGMTEELQRRWNPNCEVEGGRDVMVRVTFQLGVSGQVVGDVDRPDPGRRARRSPPPAPSARSAPSMPPRPSAACPANSMATASPSISTPERPAPMTQTIRSLPLLQGPAVHPALRDHRAGAGGAGPRRDRGQREPRRRPAAAGRRAGLRRRPGGRRYRPGDRRPTCSARACSAPWTRPASSRRTSTAAVQPRFGDWKTINAQALVNGQVTVEGGKLRVDFRLWDVFAEQQLLGLQFTSSPENWRRVAHKISDAVYERLTGEKGYFDTRVVFVAESGGARQDRQAPGDHGPGRRQPQLPDRRRLHRHDAPVLREQPGDHLHVAAAGQLHRSTCSTWRPRAARAWAPSRAWSSRRASPPMAARWRSRWSGAATATSS